MNATLADEDFAAQVVSSEIVYHGRVWDVRRDVFKFGAELLERDYLVHTGAVAIVALDGDDRVLLIRQYRHPAGAKLWEIPAGLLDLSGESPLDAAKRELAEEVDLVAEDWSTLITMATTPGGSNERIRVYLARNLSATTEPFAREAEEADIEQRWVPLADCVDAVLAGNVSNAPLCLAILAAAEAKRRDWSTLTAADTPWS